MKFHSKTSLTTLLLAMAAVVPAGAVSVATGDLILGIRSTNAALPGNGSYYVVNLGQASQYTSISSPFTIGSASTTGQDLVDIYGSNWASRTDLQWAVIGGTSGNDLYASKAATDTITVPTPWQINTQSGRNLAYSDVANVLGIGINGGLDDAPATGNTTFAAVETNALQNYWRGYLAPGGNAGQAGSTGSIDFHSFGSPGIEGTPDQTLSLFKITSSAPAEWSGSFSLLPDGAIAFVPEPSSMLLLCGSVIPLLTRRRKS